MNKPYTYLKSYLTFLQKNCYEGLIQRAKEKLEYADLQECGFLSRIPEDVVFRVLRTGLEDVFSDVINDAPHSNHRQKVIVWKKDGGPVKTNQIKVDDITNINNARKEALLDFLDYYDCPKSDLVTLIREIDTYFKICIDLSLNAYEELLQGELLDRNEVIQGILSNIPVVVTKINRVGDVIYSAGAGLRSLGRKDNDFKNYNVLADYFPENVHHTKLALQGKTVSYIGRVKSVSGEIREFQNYYIPEKTGLLGFSIDITDKIEAEARFRSLTESVRDYAIFKLSPEGIISSWNEGAFALNGYKKEEIIGKHFSIFYEKYLQDEKFPQYELEQAALHGRFEAEGFRLRKDGSRFWANAVITALRDEDDTLVGYTKITRDITERKEAEERLRKSEERHRLLIEGVRDYAIFMLEPDGTIASWNEGAKRLKGYTEEEIIGKHFSVFYTQEKKDQKFPEFELEQAKKFGMFEDEGMRVRKDGTLFYANVLITALRDSEGNLLGFSKITRDLTERKQMEEKLQAMNSELENKVIERTDELLKSINELKRINNDLDNFIYTASHDLKAPISNIEGLISSLYEELGAASEGDTSLQEIKGMINISIEKFQATIKDLTEIAKIQKNIESAEMLGLTEIIEDVKYSISDQIAKNNAQVVYSIDGCEQIKFVRKNLKSIIYNLISNGIKYRSQHREPVVKISCSRDSKYDIIVCQDNGLGIRKENLSQIFSMFKRFHDHVEGTGVGLYIVQRIIENSGGKIEVESVENEGSIFKVYLPR